MDAVTTCIREFSFPEWAVVWDADSLWELLHAGTHRITLRSMCMVQLWMTSEWSGIQRICSESVNLQERIGSDARNFENLL